MAKTRDGHAQQAKIKIAVPKTGDPKVTLGKGSRDPAPELRRTKATLLRDLLGDPAGVSLQTLMLATGWQAHTVRAALSGLRKSGMHVTRASGEGGPIYTATPARDNPVKAAGTSIAESSLSEATLQMGDDSTAPPLATSRIAPRVGGTAAPASTDALVAGATAASDTTEGEAS